MKTSILLGIFFLNLTTLFAQCDDYNSAISNTESYANDAYSYAKKAYNSDNLDDAQYYAKKAMNSADDAIDEAGNAQSYASDCGCDDGISYASNAESNADDAYSYAKKAYNSDTIEDAQYYARKAKSSAEDAESEASSGSSACD